MQNAEGLDGKRIGAPCCRRLRDCRRNHEPEALGVLGTLKIESDNSLIWRTFDFERDSVSEITRLLHEAYAELARAGLNYTASYQNDETTLRRLRSGTAYVAIRESSIVATCTVYLSTTSPEAPALYRAPDVAYFGQLAVHPNERGRGLGAHLIGMAERFAAAAGKERIALDTAEPAVHLVRLYGKLGYRVVQYVQWPGKTYRSVVMSKALGSEGES
jgi:GNAT superfamily N-acetyltransferase